MAVIPIKTSLNNVLCILPVVRDFIRFLAPSDPYFLSPHVPIYYVPLADDTVYTHILMKVFPYKKSDGYTQEKWFPFPQ